MGRELQRYLMDLDKRTLDLSEMVDKQMKEAVRCFLEGDLDGAGEVIKGDETVNNLRWEIEELCVDLIATQQPVAFDLRKLISTTHIAVELERIGDYAKGIATVTGQLPAKFKAEEYQELSGIFRNMQELSSKMLEKSIEALFSGNRDESVKKANEVCEEDDAVDALCVKVYEFIYSFRSRKITGVANRDVAMKLSWIAHDLERMADRTTNIAERATYLATGRIDGISPSRY